MVNYTRLRDLLPANENVSIEYRCNAPKRDDEDDMLFGACSWNGKELISEDGDNYYLSDIIEKYMRNEEGILMTLQYGLRSNGIVMGRLTYEHF